MSKIAIAVCSALYIAAVFEGLSAVFWTLYGVSRVAYHERVEPHSFPFGRSASTWRNSGLKADPELGWITDPQDGAIASNWARRSTRVTFDATISTFGDSFVYGADVGDDETFSFFLSRLMGTGVANYGVGGYGPDQALLRLERQLSLGDQPKVVVLGMPSENIARVVNIYRRYYIPLENPNLVKPIFVQQDDSWKLVNVLTMLNDPTESAESVSEFVSKFDYWHSQNKLRPKFSFPYSVATLTALRYFALDVTRWQDLYQVPQARKTMHYVLERFSDLSRRHNFVPVLPNSIIP